MRALCLPLLLALCFSTGSASEDLRIVWKTKIGSGYSGVTVGDGRAITMYSDGESDVMAAFDLEQGRTLWTHTVAETYRGHDGSHDGPISTPVMAEGRIFGLGPRGELFALDAASGKLIWSTHLTRDHGIPAPIYGFGTSPIVEGGALVVGLGGEGTAVGGFDPATGEKRWTNGTDAVFYQSPVPVTWDGRRQVVMAGNQSLFGFEPASGEVLWKWPHGGSGGTGAFSLIPVPTGNRKLFLALSEELSKMVEVGATGSVEVTWDARTIRNSYANPVLYEGHLYGFTSRIFACVDAATGELVWRSRPPGDGFLTLINGGRLAVFTKEGSAHLVDATPEAYREIAARPVFEDLVWTPPRFVDGSIYARSLGEIARVEPIGQGRRFETPRESARLAPEIGVGSAFGRFLTEVNVANAEDKAALVERFLASQESFPIIEDNHVHFVYRGEAEDVALYGDMFSMRREQPMARLAGADLFYYSLELEPDTRLAYLFVKDFEGLVDPLNPRRTSRFFLNDNREMNPAGNAVMSWFAMPEWQAPAHLAAPEVIRGSLEPHEVESAVLERTIGLEVYLPPGYGESRHPVAYVYGGAQARERSRLTTSLDNLIGKTVEPVIVVFVDLDVPLFGALAQLPRYEEALVEEVVPFIDGQFKTQASPDRRAGVAAWFAGHLALSASLRHPDVFGKFATQSVFLTEPSLRYFETMLEGVGDTLPRGYMDWGKYDLRSHDEPVDLSVTNPELAQMLRRRGIVLAGGEVPEGSGWLSWASRNDRIFESLFPLTHE